MTQTQTQPDTAPAPAATMPEHDDGPRYASEFERLLLKPSSANMRSIYKGEDQSFTTYDGREIVLNIKMLKVVMGESFRLATKEESSAFVHYCVANRLDPFRKQVYFIKYKQNQAPAFVTSWEVFLDRMNRHPMSDGFEAGIVWHVRNGDKITVLRGQPCDFTPDENHEIVGGWSRVYRKDKSRPRALEVPLSEMQATRWDKETGGKVPTRMWAEMTTTMCMKTPTARAIRQTFPDALGGLYAEGESTELVQAAKDRAKAETDVFGFGDSSPSEVTPAESEPEPAPAPPNGRKIPLFD